VDIEVARRYFANAIEKSGFMPDFAEITIRSEPALGTATVIQCRWPLIEKGTFSGNYSRAITVQINARAMQLFCSVDPKDRGAMLDQFVRVLYTRLTNGHYDEKGASSPVFIVGIDEDSLKP
jgi:hypothetical protein